MPPPTIAGYCEHSDLKMGTLDAATRPAEPLVEILMATCNGEKFLAAQIESLIAQTYTNWRLIVRDDASGDESPKIVKEYSTRYPDKIDLVVDEDGQLGACQSFARLLKHATANYMMFCDQDDIWLPRKVELSVDEIRKLEKKYPGAPLLVFTDLTVVNEELGVLSDSLWRLERTNPRNTSLKLLIFDNVATGCTMIFNKPLKDFALPIPDQALMHDWWLALVCSVHGQLSFLSDRTVLYRQHGRNDVGAQNNSLAFRVRRFLKSPKGYISRPRIMVNLARTQAQKLFAHAQTNVIRDPRGIIPVQRYLQSSTLLQRKWCLVRYKMLSGSYIKAVKKLLFN